MKHGKGVSFAAADGHSDKFGYTWRAGDVYDGDWEKDVRHGDCEYTWFNGEKLKCRWVNGKSPEWTAKNAEILARPPIDVQIWDLAGQDVYTLSHAVHFSHRCLYALLWKPYEALPTVMLRVAPWLESLCAHVPDAHVVLVASHCKTNITDEQFLALSGQVEAAARAKVQELNDMTRLEVDKLRAQLAGAGAERQRLEDEYAAHASSTPELTLADSAFLLQQVQGAGGSGLFAARAAAGAALPRSLRTRAADVQHATARERLLRERLQLLLGIRNGACPDDRAACKLTLHCKSMDSVEGHGVAELRG